MIGLSRSGAFHKVRDKQGEGKMQNNTNKIAKFPDIYFQTGRG